MRPRSLRGTLGLCTACARRRATPSAVKTTAPLASLLAARARSGPCSACQLLRHEKVTGSDYSLCNPFGSAQLLPEPFNDTNVPQVAMGTATATPVPVMGMAVPPVQATAPAEGVTFVSNEPDC